MSSLFVKTALLGSGWAQNVRIEWNADRITQIEADTEPHAGDLNLGDQILLPAIGNLHSHSFQRAMAGLTEYRGDSRDSFWSWRHLMYQFLDQLTPGDLYTIARFAFMEMLEAGYGAVAEFHYVHHQVGGALYDNPAETSHAIIHAAQDVGIGLTHLPVFYAYGGVDQRALQGGQKRFGHTMDQFEKLLGDCEQLLRKMPDDYRLGLAPHSLRAVSQEQLDHLAVLRPNDPIHMHIAEQLAEIDEIEHHYGQRPMSCLMTNYDVDARWCLIHSTHLNDYETQQLAKSGAVAGLCPITEANLGDGIFNGVEFLELGGTFGVGSDSDIRITLSEELRVLEHSQRYRHKGRAMLASANGSNGATLFNGVAKGGAQALGRDHGAIEVGKLADFFTLDRDRMLGHGLTGDRQLEHWIFASDDQAIDQVWSAGRHMVTRGQHKNHEAIRADYIACLKKLRSEL